MSPNDAVLALIADLMMAKLVLEQRVRELEARLARGDERLAEWLRSGAAVEALMAHYQAGHVTPSEVAMDVLRDRLPDLAKAMEAHNAADA